MREYIICDCDKYIVNRQEAVEFARLIVKKQSNGANIDNNTIMQCRQFINGLTETVHVYLNGVIAKGKTFIDEKLESKRVMEHLANPIIELKKKIKDRNIDYKRVSHRNAVALRDIKEATGCCICGNRNHIVLQFHHVDERLKQNHISHMKQHSIEAILAEIEGTNGSGGCIVMCSNCHDIEEDNKRRFKVNLLGSAAYTGNGYKYSIWDTLENWNYNTQCLPM